MRKICDVNIPVPPFKMAIKAFYQTVYHDGHLAVVAQQVWEPDPEEGDMGGPEDVPFSVNIPEAAAILQQGEFFAKNWSEAAPAWKAVLASGIIQWDGRTVPTGHVAAPIVRFRPPYSIKAES